VYNPVLLMQGKPLEIVQAVITALVGIYSLSAALEKFVFKWNISQIERAMLFVSAILLIVPGTLTDVSGFIVLIGILCFRMLNDKKATTQNAL